MLRAILAVLACVFSLPAIGFGGLMLWDWLAVRGGQQFYVGSELRDYFLRGLLCVGAGVWGLKAAVDVTFRGNQKPGLLTTACGSAFAGCILAMTYTFLASPVAIANSDVVLALGNLKSGLWDWAERNGRYPQNEAELRSSATGLQLHSPFKRGDVSFFYELSYVGEAEGPVLSEPPPQRPGIVFCAFSKDLRQSWITVTSLEKRVGGPVVWMRLLGQPRVEGGRLPDRIYRPPGELPPRSAASSK